jgi:hypothetical protein
MATLTPEQRFEAALARFQDHTEVLRAMTGFDLQIFGGYITVQLALGAWLGEHPPQEWRHALGLFVVDVVLSALAAKLLFNNYMRRKEVVASLGRVLEFLQFRQAGEYLPEKTLDVPTVFRPWWWWYMVGVAFGFIGVAVLIFSSLV